EPALEASLELPVVECEEVRALLPLDVDHLDELALAHLVGERTRRVDAEVEARFGKRRREFLLLVAPRLDAPDLHEQLRRTLLAVHHVPAPPPRARAQPA